MDRRTAPGGSCSGITLGKSWVWLPSLLGLSGGQVLGSERLFLAAETALAGGGGFAHVFPAVVADEAFDAVGVLVVPVASAFPGGFLHAGLFEGVVPGVEEGVDDPCVGPFAVGVMEVLGEVGAVESGGL